MALLIPKKSIYADSINKNIGLFSQAGLIVKWARNAQTIFDFDNSIYLREPPDRVVLTAKQLGTAFFILFFGELIACILFIIELRV